VPLLAGPAAGASDAKLGSRCAEAGFLALAASCWKQSNKRNASFLKSLTLKYHHQIPLIFADGPARLLAPLKRLVTQCVGLFRPSWGVEVARFAQSR
jgi:hypothetical protein